MTNAEIANTFDEVADLLEFTGANAFRIRAYRNAARMLRDLSTSVAAMVLEARGQLTDLDGIGDDLADKITTLVKTGSLPQLQELLGKVPASALTLLRVPGIGPKKAAALLKELNISTLDELRAACEQQRVRALKGFGEKTEEHILAGIALASAAGERMLWADADTIVQDVLAHLRGCKSIEQIEPAGSYRRGKDTVGDLDFLVVANDPTEVMDRLAEYPGVAEVLGRGETKMSVRLQSGAQVDVRVVGAESYGAALQYFTGSKEHNVIVRSRAKQQGLKINEYGVFRGEERIAGQSEQAVYEALGWPWFPPELREARQEFAWAEAGKLPKLIELDDLQGDLHMHTTDTDGKNTLEEMVEAARSRGLKYIAITDHSQRVTMANGLDAPRVRQQWRAIDQLNRHLRGFHVLKGIEVDILEKGGLDLDDDVLCEADWVVASVHYGQNQPREQITARIVAALRHPSVSAIAHPTGRLLNRRQPYAVDLEQVMNVAREEGKILELNSNPQRLDLDDVACAAAKAQRVPIVISSDAHSVRGFDVLRYGILQARRAGLTKHDVVNTQPYETFIRH